MPLIRSIGSDQEAVGSAADDVVENPQRKSRERFFPRSSKIIEAGRTERFATAFQQTRLGNSLVNDIEPNESCLRLYGRYQCLRAQGQNERSMSPAPPWRVFLANFYLTCSR